MRQTLADIAQLLGGKIVGNGDLVITGISGIKEASPGDLTFLANPKYLSLASATKASAIIVENDVRYNELLREFMNSSYREVDISDSLRREQYLKRNNKGVRKAWDHYQLMLKLAWEGKDVG